MLGPSRAYCRRRVLSGKGTVMPCASSRSISGTATRRLVPHDWRPWLTVDGCTTPTSRDGAVRDDGAGAVRPLGWVRRRPPPGQRAEVGSLIFKAVRDGRPYPDHGLSTRDWALIPPRQVRMDTLTTTRKELALDALLADDSTFYGDLFPHAVQWHGELYLEDGLHRALRAALQQRNVIHVRVLDLDALTPVQAPSGPATAAIPVQPPVPNARRN